MVFGHILWFLRWTAMMNSIDLETINHYWAEVYGDTPPVAYDFKILLPHRWVRFHYLPESKRYPDTEQEYQTILNRFQTLLQECCKDQENEPCFLVTAAYTEGLWQTDPFLAAFDAGAVFWKTLLLDDGGESPSVFQLMISQWTLRHGCFDPLLRRVAEGGIGNVFLFGGDRRQPWLFHPYDGGVDLILADSARRDALKATFSAWLSDHASGL